MIVNNQPLKQTILEAVFKPELSSLDKILLRNKLKENENEQDTTRQYTP